MVLEKLTRDERKGEMMQKLEYIKNHIPDAQKHLKAGKRGRSLTAQTSLEKRINRAPMSKNQIMTILLDKERYNNLTKKEHIKIEEAIHNQREKLAAIALAGIDSDAINEYWDVIEKNPPRREDRTLDLNLSNLKLTPEEKAENKLMKKLIKQLNETRLGKEIQKEKKELDELKKELGL